MSNFYTHLDSPFGPLLLISDGQALTGLYMSESRYGQAVRPDWICDPQVAPFPLAREQLEAYFAGRLKAFDLPLALRGTPFQQQVWQALQAIPFGATVSYAALAKSIGRSASVRAVGQANGHNPVSIVVPCHRVIGSDGSLTGYGGGLDRKAALLAFEASVETN